MQSSSEQCRLKSGIGFCPKDRISFLTAQSECIDKAIAHIEAKQLDPNFFLNMRLFPDMYPGAAGEHSRRQVL